LTFHGADPYTADADYTRPLSQEGAGCPCPSRIASTNCGGGTRCETISAPDSAGSRSDKWTMPVAVEADIRSLGCVRRGVRVTTWVTYGYVSYTDVENARHREPI